MVEFMFRNATHDDVLDVAGRLRDDDRKEVQAAVGLPPSVALPTCVEASRETWVFGAHNRPEGLIGVQDIAGVPGVGWAWMVATDSLDKYGMDFALRCPRYLPLIHKHHRIITNHVDERNKTHIKWLRWIGCTFIRRLERWGAESRPFLEFARYQPPCASAQSAS